MPENITQILPGELLPNEIISIPDDILNWAIKCPKSGQYFKVQPLELEMSRKFGVPIPKLHPTERIKNLLDWDKREFIFHF